MPVTVWHWENNDEQNRQLPCPYIISILGGKSQENKQHDQHTMMCYTNKQVDDIKHNLGRPPYIGWSSKAIQSR